MKVVAIVLALLLGAESRAGVCKGEDGCTACVNCGSCFYCSARNPHRGSCGVLRAQADREYQARLHRDRVAELRWIWSSKVR